MGVEIDGGLAAGDKGGAIRFADGTADEHLSGIEDADDGLATPELIAFLGMAHGIVAIETLVGNEAGERGVQFEFGHIRLGAFEHDFLAVALEFEDAKGGGIAAIVRGHGFGEASDVSAGVLEANVGFEAVDFAEDGTFLDLDSGLGEIGLGLAEVRDAFFGVGTILGAFLFHLVSQVVELGLGVAGLIDLRGAVEDGDEVAYLYLGAVGDELGEGHPAPLTEDFGDEDFGGADGFEGAGDADFAFGARGVGRGGVGNRRDSAGAGGEEKERDRDGQRRRHGYGLGY